MMWQLSQQRRLFSASGHFAEVSIERGEPIAGESPQIPLVIGLTPFPANRYRGRVGWGTDTGFGLGVDWTREGRDLIVPRQIERAIRPDEGNATPKIEDGIWPAFPSDLMSVCIVLATQTIGTALFFEKMFESRMYFVDHLMGMGANIIQCDPHRVVVIGPTELRGGMLTSPDIRAGMAMLIAACCAKGESVIKNAQVIDRGYEAIEDRLTALGADIVRVD